MQPIPIDLKGMDLALVHPDFPWLAFCFNDLSVDENGRATFDYTVIESARSSGNPDNEDLNFGAIAEEMLLAFLENLKDE